MTMMTNSDILNRIIWAFEADYDDFVIEVDEGIKVSVEIFDFYDAECIDDCAYFMGYCNGARFGAENLDEFVEKIAEIKEVLDDRDTEIEELNNLKAKIDAHNNAEKEFAKLCQRVVMDAWYDTALKGSLVDFLNSDECVEIIRSLPFGDENYNNELLQLAFDMDTYSDWHKDVYGFRPR